MYPHLSGVAYNGVTNRHTVGDRMDSEQNKRLVSVADASKETGVPVSTIYAAIDRGDIPCEYPIPGNTRFKLVSPADVLEWKSDPTFHKPGPEKTVSKTSE